MNLHSRQKMLMVLALCVLGVHLAVAAIARASFALMIFSDAFPCATLVIAILAATHNSRRKVGILPLFWKLMTAGLFMMLASQIFWFYYDYKRQVSTPSPVVGDSLFLLPVDPCVARSVALQSKFLPPGVPAASRHYQCACVSLCA